MEEAGLSNRDIRIRLQTTVYSRISVALKHHKALRRETSFELLGCDVYEYRKYLESLFKKGMTWENYGIHGWHVDHIKDCFRFDLKDPEQQKECFHYTNTQPLWAKENWGKPKL